MQPWTFLYYETEDGERLAQNWYEAQDEAVQAEIDAALAILRATDDWRDAESKTGYVRQFAELKRRHCGIAEIRIEVIQQDGKKRKFRLAGIWREKERQFIVLVGCAKTGQLHILAFDLALKLKRQYAQGRGRMYGL